MDVVVESLLLEEEFNTTLKYSHDITNLQAVYLDKREAKQMKSTGVTRLDEPRS